MTQLSALKKLRKIQEGNLLKIGVKFLFGGSGSRVGPPGMTWDRCPIVVDEGYA